MLDLIPRATDVTFEDLLEVIAFEQRSVTVFGKVYPQPRLTKWYGPVPYAYSNLRWEAEEMPELLKRLRDIAQERAGCELPTCLANLYRNGRDKVGWHSDDEDLFGSDPVIASFSFGCARDFKVRPKGDTSGTQTLSLEPQSLLIMPSGFQSTHEHSLPARKRVSEPRINLTFRPLGTS